MEQRQESVGLFDRPLRVVHVGDRYSFGFGPDFYGIWDEVTPGGPVERFPATLEGRQEGWRRYRELEPSAAGVEPWPKVTPEELEAARRAAERRRRRIVTLSVTAVVAVGIATGVVLGGGGATGKSGEEAGPTGTTASVQVSGDLAVTEDLQEQSFTAQGLGSLYARVEARWAGPQVQLFIGVDNPVPGQSVAATELRRTLVELTITPAGNTTSHTFQSKLGECTLTFDTVAESGVRGHFECTGLHSADGSKTIDAQGTFEASAQAGS
ncbi:MAG TPA: hypothetical protein VNO34_04690 [Actinomycetota bacterium]|nr:hypothetical protein [Actinomycetota bacterium]